MFFETSGSAPEPGSLDPEQVRLINCVKARHEYLAKCGRDAGAIIAPPVSCVEQANLDFKLCVIAIDPIRN